MLLVYKTADKMFGRTKNILYVRTSKIYLFILVGVICAALVESCPPPCTLECSPNAVCREDHGKQRCYCNEGYVGDGVTCTRLYRDCNDIHQADITADGIYEILPTDWPGAPFNVLCNMSSDGGGWTVFQRRTNGETDFYRNWQSYKSGFGSLENEFWLGNEKLHYLTKQNTYELRIDMVTSQDAPLFQKYNAFAINSETENYKMILDRGTVRTGLFYNAGRRFSTFDRDNDLCGKFNCAEQHRGGWWYGQGTWCKGCYQRHCSNFIYGSCNTACTDSNLNGDYQGGNGQSMIWYRNAASRYCNMKYADMKIRPTT